MLMYMFCCVSVIPKVSPQEVGEQETLNLIRDDIAGILEESEVFEMNQVCYCNGPLVRDLWNRPFDDWYCDSCFTKQNGRVTFKCFNESCSFRNALERIYRVCPSCFHGVGKGNEFLESDEKEEKKEGTVIYRRINHSINVISSVSRSVPIY